MSQEKKFSLWSLLTDYNKIEVPIIQRDYAQGRETKEVNKIRKDFVNYLVQSLVKEKPVELDFVYGIKEGGLFIPLDGQQRLTTLYLLHWYLAYKEDRLDDVKDTLIKFSYETRASSHDFMACLCTISLPKVDKITLYIRNKAYWFDTEWMLDPSVSGMLTMLECIERNESLNSNLGNLFDRLTSDKKLISFYFLPLEEFGLSDDLYIRMNARGKILNEFENFKSNFYRIIKEYPNIDQIKTKMEYNWVDNLWDYRKDKKHEFVVDNYFMNFLEYITKMLFYHYHNTLSRNRADISFRELELFGVIYNENKNTEFLEFCLDILPELRKFNIEKDWYWEKSSTLPKILENCIVKGKLENQDSLLLYGALLFCYVNKRSFNGLEDYLRVLRNLIYNTDDTSERDWSKIIGTIERLIFDNSDVEMNIYKHLTSNDINIEGFYVPQKNEEIFKAELKCLNNTTLIDIINRAEDNEALHGNIIQVLKASYTDDELIIRNLSTTDLKVTDIDVKMLDGIVTKYEILSKNDFNDVFGDLITSSLYKFKKECIYISEVYDLCRCVYDDDYSHNPAIISIAKDWYLSGKTLSDYLDNKEATFISMIPDINNIPDMQSQLYTLYIVSKQIYHFPLESFFKNGYNFGCTDDTSSKFHKPFYKIENTYIENHIFQTYTSQFQYNRGLLDQRIPDIYWRAHSEYIPEIKKWAKNILNKKGSPV